HGPRRLVDRPGARRARVPREKRATRTRQPHEAPRRPHGPRRLGRTAPSRRPEQFLRMCIDSRPRHATRGPRGLGTDMPVLARPPTGDQRGRELSMRPSPVSHRVAGRTLIRILVGRTRCGLRDGPARVATLVLALGALTLALGTATASAQTAPFLDRLPALQT